MTRFLLRRLAASAVLFLLVLSAAFFLIRLAPGDPTLLLSEDFRISREQRESLRRLYGLDRPLLEQYAVWLGSAVRGDWGISFSLQRPVTAAILQALKTTALLSAFALVIEWAVALPLGVAAARRHGSAADHGIRVVSLLLYSIPPFWLGLMLILVFAYLWPVLPPSHLHSVGAQDLGPFERLVDLGRHLILPALALGLFQAGATTRFVRGSLLEVLGRDYIRTARAKGLSERRVVWAHGLRTALTPLIQIFGLSLPALLSGSLVTEVVFALPGLGRLTFEAVLTRDYPLILGATAFGAVVALTGNLAADLLQAATDPRVRDSAA